MINWLADDLMELRGATLDPITEPDVETAWSAEIERRLVEIADVRSELFGECGWSK